MENLNIDISSFIPKHKYIRVYDNENQYQADVDAHDMHECCYAVVNKANDTDEVEYQPSHRENEFNDNEKLIPYFTNDDVRLWAGLKIIWGYFGWEEKTYSHNGEQLLGGQFYIVKPMTVLKTVPDLYQYEHLVDFLKNVNTVDTYEEQDFSTIKVAGYLVNNLNTTTPATTIPTCYTEMDSLEKIVGGLYNIKNGTDFEADIINVNNLTTLSPFIIVVNEIIAINTYKTFYIYKKISVDKLLSFNQYCWAYEANYVKKFIDDNEDTDIIIDDIKAFINLNSINASDCLYKLYVPSNTNKNIVYNIGEINRNNDNNDNVIPYSDGIIINGTSNSIPNNITINIDVERLLTLSRALLIVPVSNANTIDFKNKLTINIIDYKVKLYGYSFFEHISNAFINIDNLEINYERATQYDTFNLFSTGNANLTVDCNNLVINGGNVGISNADVYSDNFNVYIHIPKGNTLNLLRVYLYHNNVIFNTDDYGIYKNDVYKYELTYNNEEAINFVYNDINTIDLINSNGKENIYATLNELVLNLNCTDDSTFKFNNRKNNEFNNVAITINSDYNPTNITILDNYIVSTNITYNSNETDCDKVFKCSNANLTLGNVDNVELYILDLYSIDNTNKSTINLKFTDVDYFKIRNVKSDNSKQKIAFSTISVNGVNVVDFTDFILMPLVYTHSISAVLLTIDKAINYKLGYGCYSINLNDLVDELDFTIWHDSLLANLEWDEKSNAKQYNILTLNRRLYNKFTDTEKEQLVTIWKTINIRENEDSGN